MTNVLFEHATVWTQSWSSSNNAACKYAVVQRAVAQCAVAQRPSQQAKAKAKPEPSQAKQTNRSQPSDVQK